MYASAAPYSSAGRGGARDACPSASAPARMNAEVAASSFLSCSRPDEEAGRATFNYTGAGRGGYVQECKYKYVGNGEGDFEMMTVKKKKPNYTLCYGLFVSVVLLGIFAITAHVEPDLSDILPDDRPTTTSNVPVVEKPEPAAPPKVEDPYASAPPFGCFEKGLDRGDRVRAAAPISFVPAGLVQEGAMGTVVLDGPGGDKGSSEGSRPVIVTWDDIPGLKNSKVTRDMIERTIRKDTMVEAIVDMQYRFSPDYKPPRVHLDVADLVRATEDLGSVRTGTFGTVVSVPEHGRAVVRFANQMDTVRVEYGHIAKVPQVGDHVRALIDLQGVNLIDEESTVVVAQGSMGHISAVTPADDGRTYAFAVDWALEGTPEVEASAEQLETIIEPEYSVVSAGTIGRVLEVPTLGVTEDRLDPSATLVVDWQGIRGPGSVVQRAVIEQSDAWSTEKTNYCCARGLFCPKTHGDANKFDCKQGTVQEWEQDKRSWCCANKELGCVQKSTQPATTTPVGPPAPFAVVNFDPSPRTFDMSTPSPLAGFA